jgi:ubiquinol-cytochrome c reductase cytochrome c1 subunit
MPRVGVSAESMEKVMEYLEDSGDTKRHERNSVGVKVMMYLIVFAIFAYLWKREIWKELH